MTFIYVLGAICLAAWLLLEWFAGRSPIIKVVGGCVRAASGLASVVSGEFLLVRPWNGSGVIAMRATYLAMLVFLSGVYARAWLQSGGEPPLSFKATLYDAHDKLTWFAAAWAAGYAGLYAKFASQWRYLSDLYNQIQISEAGEDASRFVKLKVAFISDAVDLHLAEKQPFLGICVQWWEDPAVSDGFLTINRRFKERRHLRFADFLAEKLTP